MGMIMYPAGAVIKQMGGNDQRYGWYQQPAFILVKELLQHQEGEAQEKQNKGLK
jgi:hypothetical protein